VPSQFLKDRMPAFLAEIGGEETVQYIPVDVSGRDADTGDLDESAAYATTPVSIPALVDFSPSEATRRSIGLEIDFDAALTVTTEHLNAESITLKIGDAFILPNQTDKYYVTRIVQRSQTETGFLTYLVALSHRVGRH